MIYLQLFWEFFKTGLFSVGGGLATLPFLYDMSARHGWFTEAELADMVAVSESTPGPIGINMATYVGVRTAGVLGGLVATFSEILPCLLVILLIVSLLTRFEKNSYVQSCMKMLRPTSVGLIGAAVYSVMKVALLNTGAYAAGGLLACFRLPAILLFAGLCALAWKFPKLHPIVLIAAGAAIGILFKM